MYQQLLSASTNTTGDGYEVRSQSAAVAITLSADVSSGTANVHIDAAFSDSSWRTIHTEALSSSTDTTSIDIVSLAPNPFTRLRARLADVSSLVDSGAAAITVTVAVVTN